MSDSNVIAIDEFRPHAVAEMECHWGHRWVAVFQPGTEKLECPGCGAMIDAPNYPPKVETDRGYPHSR